MALNWKPREMGDCLLKIHINKMDLKIRKTQTDQLAIWDLFSCWLSSHCTQNKDLELSTRGLSCLEMFGVEAGGMSSREKLRRPITELGQGKQQIPHCSQPRHSCGIRSPWKEGSGPGALAALPHG